LRRVSRAASPDAPARTTPALRARTTAAPRSPRRVCQRQADPPSTGATAVPTDVANDIDLRKHVSLQACRRIAGGWAASGTATNPGTEPVDYTITIFFTTAKATVVGTGETHVKVDPGHEKTWTVDRKLATDSKTLCVLRGVG